MLKTFLLIVIIVFVNSCGKVGPLSLPENRLDKSVITYPCDKDCMKRLNEEKKRQQSVIIQSN
tara:strand:+ start:429 stop:617 length:189 start_codon:yes stop_codon:yes gene_type:complete